MAVKKNIVSLNAPSFKSDYRNEKHFSFDRHTSTMQLTEEKIESSPIENPLSRERETIPIDRLYIETRKPIESVVLDADARRFAQCVTILSIRHHLFRCGAAIARCLLSREAETCLMLFCLYGWLGGRATRIRRKGGPGVVSWRHLIKTRN